MTKKPTLADVARVAGVSLATVDRVINNRGGVDPAKEEAVMRAARTLELDRRLDYAHRQIKRITVMIQPPENPFHAELGNGIDTARKFLAALNIQVAVTHTRIGQIRETVAKIISLPERTDGLVISAPDTPEIAAALMRIRAQVPVITLASDIAGSGRIAFIGPDDERSGRVAADLMGLFLGPQGGDVLIVAGHLHLAGQRARARGFESLLSGRYPDCRIHGIVETGENSDATATRVHEALSQNPSIRGIYHLSVGAVGIVDAIDRLGRRNEVHVITHELTPNRRRLLRQRRLHAVLDQDPHLEARLAIETLARHFGRLEGPVTSFESAVQIFMPESL
ncbi:LacI family DNA-binding transcriptional regulator [Tropicimonas sp.]|uniref:LacI family DNA-binding transcriptional regulator n=1 Tax=Tropicimonas sp. TaxID=2067044 RepID=UPI003A8B968E